MIDICDEYLKIKRVINWLMFYINRNLKTELAFSHYDMDKLASD